MLRPLNLSLKQRISYLIKVPALSSADTLNYLQHRLKSAGIERRVFSDNGINAIFSASQGIPREINRIAFTALNLAAEAGQNTVSDNLLSQAIEEMELKP